MINDYDFLNSFIERANNEKEAGLIKLFPRFVSLLSSALAELYPKSHVAQSSKLYILNFWIMSETESGVSAQASTSPRARKLKEKLDKFGFDEDKALDYFHDVITRGEQFDAVFIKMLELQKKGRYPKEFIIGANLLFLFRLFAKVLLVEVIECRNELSLFPLGIFWLGSKPLLISRPGQKIDDYLQWRPTYLSS